MRLLTCRKDTRSAAETAGYNAIGQDTRQLQKAVPGTGRGHETLLRNTGHTELGR